MTFYIGLVHKEPESAYGVQFPDVPGCFSAADEAEHLLAEAAQALALHLEDEAAPPPARSIEALRADPEIAVALREGAFLIIVPFVRLTGRTVKANLTMDAGLLAAVDRTAKARRLRRSAYLTDLARRDIIGH